MLSPASPQPTSQNTPLLLWTNQPNNPSFKAFLSTLGLCKVNWQFQANPSHANVWCILDLEEDEQTLSNHYLELVNKPKVVYLGTQFVVAPIAEWVFFKSPINIQALNSWLTKHQFLNSAQSSVSPATVATVAGKERWQTESFKLQYWPNVSNYTDNPEIVQICSILMRDWTNYATIATSHLPKSTIQQLLADAEAEGNLIYQPAHERVAQVAGTSHDHAQSTPKAEQKDNAWGFFKGLFSRFVK